MNTEQLKQRLQTLPNNTYTAYKAYKTAKERLETFDAQTSEHHRAIGVKMTVDQLKAAQRCVPERVELEKEAIEAEASWEAIKAENGSLRAEAGIVAAEIAALGKIATN